MRAYDRHRKEVKKRAEERGHELGVFLKPRSLKILKLSIPNGLEYQLNKHRVGISKCINCGEVFWVIGKHKDIGGRALNLNCKGNLSYTQTMLRILFELKQIRYLIDFNNARLNIGNRWQHS